MNTKNASAGDQSGSGGLKSLFGVSIVGSLQDWGKKISHPTVFTMVALVLVASSSFALGRLSVLEQSREPVRIEYQEQTATVANAVDSEVSAVSGAVVASKNGSVYYFPWCGGALKIAEANKVTFATETLAKNAGLRPAANCKGMER